MNTATAVPRSKGLRLAHAPMPGIQRMLRHVLGDANTAEARMLPMAAYRIPLTLVTGDADAGVWWDTAAPHDLSGSILAESDLVVVANPAASLPSRPLLASDLDDLTMVGFGGLGHQLLASFCQRMATAGAVVRFGNPKKNVFLSDTPMFTLTPGASDTAEFGRGMTILPLAETISAHLVLATSPHKAAATAAA